VRGLGSFDRHIMLQYLVFARLDMFGGFQAIERFFESFLFNIPAFVIGLDSLAVLKCYFGELGRFFCAKNLPLETGLEPSR